MSSSASSSLLLAGAVVQVPAVAAAVAKFAPVCGPDPGLSVATPRHVSPLALIGAGVVAGFPLSISPPPGGRPSPAWVRI